MVALFISRVSRACEKCYKENLETTPRMEESENSTFQNNADQIADDQIADDQIAGDMV